MSDSMNRTQVWPNPQTHWAYPSIPLHSHTHWYAVRIIQCFGAASYTLAAGAHIYGILTHTAGYIHPTQLLGVNRYLLHMI